jgi:DNA mismatch endonuclease (patch repair protein)
MQAVKQKNTAPEMKVRREAHRIGLRFRLNVDSLPGKPDLAFPKWKICIFVHGCFWHSHAGCRRSTTPATNREFWLDKFRKTIERDRRVSHELELLGWRPEVIWECEIRSKRVLREKLGEIFVRGYL